MTEPPITNDWGLPGDFQDPNTLCHEAPRINRPESEEAHGALDGQQRSSGSSQQLDRRWKNLPCCHKSHLLERVEGGRNPPLQVDEQHEHELGHLHEERGRRGLPSTCIGLCWLIVESKCAAKAAIVIVVRNSDVAVADEGIDVEI
jgi:hypothetical protein